MQSSIIQGGLSLLHGMMQLGFHWASLLVSVSPETEITPCPMVHGCGHEKPDRNVQSPTNCSCTVPGKAWAFSAAGQFAHLTKVEKILK